MSGSALAASGLHVRLGRREVLRALDVAFPPGQLTIIVGPNGAGKTTLVRALAGLIPPSGGSVTFGGTRIETIARLERARLFAYLPQNGGVSWPLPVRALVALGRMPYGEAPEKLTEEGRRAVREAIAAAGLGGFEERPVTELSGGERGRALLARALATKAPVLLADEPVAALDPRHQLLVLDVLRGLARGGSIVVAVMHDLSLASRFADEILLMDEGVIVASGAPEEVLTATRLESVFAIEAAVSREAGGLTITPRRALRVE